MCDLRTNGFFVEFFDYIFGKLIKVDPGELLKVTVIKLWGLKFVPVGPQDPRNLKIVNDTIDVFILLKWLFLGALIFWRMDFWLSDLLVYALIFFNAFSYFYDHGWQRQIVLRTDLKSQRRRFLNMLQAILFYLVGYAYLYQFHVAAEIVWPSAESPDFFDAFYLSVANAFTLTYPGFEPCTSYVRGLFLTELACTFVFFTVLISAAVPSRDNLGQ